ncbi:MAG: hypothetical protein J6333_10465, partial [Planctomycetes bacterium]|nr:hypothetical protein [Planctomycetota bacterium]
MQKLHEVAMSPAAGAGNKRAGRAASRIIALALGLLAPAVAAADYLIIEGGSGASADTHTLDGTPGALADDNIQGAGEDSVAITASGRGNVVDNYGKVNGPAQAAPGAGLTIVNHAGATLGPGNAGNAVQAMVAAGDEGATNYNYVDLVLDNSGTISGGVVGRGTLQLVNRGTMNGRDSGAAVNLNAGRGTLDNSGAINAGAEGVAIYNGFLIANDEEGEGNDVVRTAPTLDLYHRANGAINGDVVNHGTLNVKRFDGQMTGDIVNLGTLDVGEQKVAFTGAYASAENLDGDDEAAVTGRSTVKFAIANGKHGALRALSGGGADSGKVDLSHTDVVVTARGGIAGDRYRLVDAAKGIKVLDTANDGEGDNAETVTSSARIILNRNSLTLDYNYILHSGTDSQGYLDVAAVARPRAFHDNSNERDRDMADVLDAVAPAVPDSMRAMMWRLNTIRTSPEMRRALESVNNRSASSAMGQLSATAVAAHLNATKSLFRELG